MLYHALLEYLLQEYQHSFWVLFLQRQPSEQVAACPFDCSRAEQTDVDDVMHEVITLLVCWTLLFHLSIRDYSGLTSTYNDKRRMMYISVERSAPGFLNQTSTHPRKLCPMLFPVLWDRMDNPD